MKLTKSEKKKIPYLELVFLEWAHNGSKVIIRQKIFREVFYCMSGLENIVNIPTV